MHSKAGTIHSSSDTDSIRCNHRGTIIEPKYKTLSGKPVRSRGEKEIADFLSRQGIRFIYEPRILLGVYRVHPDFYLPEFDIYIEYFGMEDADYQRKAAYKRGEYKRNGFLLIALYYKSRGSLGAVIKCAFEKITHKPFPQKKNFDWRIKNRASNYHGYHHLIFEESKPALAGSSSGFRGPACHST